MGADRPCTRLLLIRHAQHDTASSDGGLTVLGREQAARLAGALPAAAALSSPARRSRETAAIAGAESTVVDGLAEFHFGPGWDAAAAVAERADLDLWRPEHGPRGGETIGAFQERVGETVERIVAAHPAAVLCFTHAGVIDASLRWAFGLGSEDPWQTEAFAPNASVTELEVWLRGIRPAGAPRHVTVRRVGDVSHLQGLEVTEI